MQIAQPHWRELCLPACALDIQKRNLGLRVILLLMVCSAMQNLREAIAGYRGRLMHEGNDIKRNALLQVTPQLRHAVAYCEPAAKLVASYVPLSGSLYR